MLIIGQEHSYFELQHLMGMRSKRLRLRVNKKETQLMMSPLVKKEYVLGLSLQLNIRFIRSRYI
jgi:hypothetical protein